MYEVSFWRFGSLEREFVRISRLGRVRVSEKKRRGVEYGLDIAGGVITIEQNSVSRGPPPVHPSSPLHSFVL